MKGRAFKRGRSWSIVYDEPTVDGRRRQRSRGGFKTQREAQTELTRLLGTLGDGTYVQPSKVTVRDYLNEWLPAVASTVRPATMVRYESITRGRIIPAIGNLPLQGVTASHLKTLYRTLGEATDEQPALSPASVRVAHSVLSRAFKDALADGRVVRAPTAKAPSRGDSKAVAWTPRELGAFLDAVAGDPWLALWRLAALTGARRGELLGATWLHLNLDQGSWRIEQQLLENGSFGPPKSKRSRRTVALDTATVEALRAHRDRQLLERSFAGDAYVDRDLVFADPLGAPVRPQRMTARFRVIAGKVGLPGTLHVLRHTAATLALTHGVPLHVVAARLGDRAETLLGVYSHLLPTSDAEAAATVAALIPVSKCEQ